jgi:hypothetical protein
MVVIRHRQILTLWISCAAVFPHRPQLAFAIMVTTVSRRTDSVILRIRHLDLVHAAVLELLSAAAGVGIISANANNPLRLEPIHALKKELIADDAHKSGRVLAPQNQVFLSFRPLFVGIRFLLHGDPPNQPFQCVLLFDQHVLGLHCTRRKFVFIGSTKIQARPESKDFSPQFRVMKHQAFFV